MTAGANTKVKKSTEKIEKVEVVASSDSLQNMKHPLEHAYGIWLYANKSKNWETNLIQLSSFNTVEDYWCLYHHMKSPSELKLGQDYSIFKEGIQPMWEDPANKSGGRWLISGLNNSNVDRIWLDTVLLVIGESIIHSDMICGVVVNVRAECKVCIWTRNKDQKTNMDIGKMLKRQLGLRKEIHYQAHRKNAYLYHA